MMTSTAQTHGSVATTAGIVVRVTPKYVPDHSDPDAKRYIFSYAIEIVNESERAVTLLSRHWTVVDANGHRHDVEGEGVVGKQPRIAPGESFRVLELVPVEHVVGDDGGALRAGGR